jgi:hypothetical protein
MYAILDPEVEIALSFFSYPVLGKPLEKRTSRLWANLKPDSNLTYLLPTTLDSTVRTLQMASESSMLLIVVIFLRLLCSVSSVSRLALISLLIGSELSGNKEDNNGTAVIAFLLSNARMPWELSSLLDYPFSTLYLGIYEIPSRNWTKWVFWSRRLPNMVG